MHQKQLIEAGMALDNVTQSAPQGPPAGRPTPRPAGSPASLLEKAAMFPPPGGWNPPGKPQPPRTPIPTGGAPVPSWASKAEGISDAPPTLSSYPHYFSRAFTPWRGSQGPREDWIDKGLTYKAREQGLMGGTAATILAGRALGPAVLGGAGGGAAIARGALGGGRAALSAGRAALGAVKKIPGAPTLGSASLTGLGIAGGFEAADRLRGDEPQQGAAAAAPPTAPQAAPGAPQAAPAAAPAAAAQAPPAAPEAAGAAPGAASATDYTAAQWQMTPEQLSELKIQLKTGSIPPEQYGPAAEKLLAGRLLKNVPPGANVQQHVGAEMARLAEGGYTEEDLAAVIPDWMEQGAPDAQGQPAPPEAIQTQDQSLWERFAGWFGGLRADQKIAAVIGIGLPILAALNAMMGGNAMASIVGTVLGGLGIAHSFGMFDKLLGLGVQEAPDAVNAQVQQWSRETPTETGTPGETATQQAPPGEAALGGGSPPGATPPATLAEQAAPGAAPLATPAEQAAPGHDPAKEMSALRKEFGWLDEYGGAGGKPGQFDSTADVQALIEDWTKGGVQGGALQQVLAKMSPEGRAALMAQLQTDETKDKFGFNNPVTGLFGRPKHNELLSMVQSAGGA